VIAETFVRREGMDATHVPYRGGAQATTDTVAGTVDFFVSTWPQVVALVREGRLRALGIGAPQRLPQTPDVPSFAELNATDLAVDAWFGMWAPARTDAAIVARLSDTLVGILDRPAMRERLTGQGFVASPMPSLPFAAFQREELARWRALVELTGIRLAG
jgi:tripartite-type tricarboxylate transporter receptor subunit TctC